MDPASKLDLATAIASAPLVSDDEFAHAGAPSAPTPPPKPKRYDYAWLMAHWPRGGMLEGWTNHTSDVQRVEWVNPLGRETQVFDAKRQILRQLPQDVVEIVWQPGERLLVPVELSGVIHRIVCTDSTCRSRGGFCWKRHTPAQLVSGLAPRLTRDAQWYECPPCFAGDGPPPTLEITPTAPNAFLARAKERSRAPR